MKARVPKGAGNNAQNMNQMIRQAQKMQDQITDLQDDIEAREFTTTAGGGAVELVMTGKKTIKSLTIKPEAVDPDDVEMLQDLILAAVNEALRAADADKENTLGRMAPAGMGGLF